MASLHITAWEGAAEVALGDIVLEEVVTITGTSALSSVIPGTRKNRRVRLFSDVKCFVTWGVTPFALTDGTDGRMLGAENGEYFSIAAGAKIAVIERV